MSIMQRAWPRRPLLLMAAVGVAVLIAGCYPGGPESYSDLGMVVTARAPQADFQGLMTYAMRDTVYELALPDTEGEPLDRRFDAAILAELRTQMEAAGFTEVDTLQQEPQMWLGVGSVQADVWYYYYYWGYWGPWCCYYPPYVGVGNFTKGSVIWQLVDVRNADPDTPPEAIWLAGINGALQSSASANESGIRSGIRQAFAQSPYIQATQPSPAGQ